MITTSKSMKIVIIFGFVLLVSGIPNHGFMRDRLIIQQVAFIVSYISLMGIGYAIGTTDTNPDVEAQKK